MQPDFMEEIMEKIPAYNHADCRKRFPADHSGHVV
jgi:hypothetical protein